MTTDLHRQTTPSNSQPPSQPPSPPPASKLDLSASKILGGALAAMTAAALGSRLSVAGTIVGAALASIIAAVAGSLYTASLARTQDKVRTVWTGRTAGGTQPTTIETVGETVGGTAHAPEASWAPVAPSVTPAANKPMSTKSRSRWKGIVVAALAAFGIAAVALTGYELISGHALSGGTGTTITQVSEPRATKSPTPKASASPSATPKESASEQPSSEPSTAPTTAPTTDPTSEPSSSSAPSASSTPTASASAPTASPSQRAQGESSP